MESRAKLLGHPLHQMLIVFPVGLLATASAFDLIRWLSEPGDGVGRLLDLARRPGRRAGRVGVADRASLNTPSSLRTAVNEP